MRAVTNALLRDLNTALVAEEMRGTQGVYVDYVDYDEIAHHAGMFRPESLASLDGLDRVLGKLDRLREGQPGATASSPCPTIASPRDSRSWTGLVPISASYARSS